MRTKSLLLLILLSVSVGIGAIAMSVAVAQDDAEGPGQIDEAFRADILKLLKLTGADKVGLQLFQQMVASLKPLAPDVPAEFWAQLEQEANMDELIEQLVPVYAKHLSHEDVKAAIVFYQTPAGRNLIAAQPKIMADSMVIGQRWGQKLAETVTQRIRDRQQAQQQH